MSISVRSPQFVGQINPTSNSSVLRTLSAIKINVLCLCEYLKKNRRTNGSFVMECLDAVIHYTYTYDVRMNRFGF